MKIKIKKGLDIPLQGKPEGKMEDLPLPKELALDLSPFDTISLALLKKEGEEVKVGEPLARDKKCPDRVFVSPASGKIKEVVRGLKRRLLSVVVETDQKQTPFSQEKGTIENLMQGGLAPHIRVRPGLRIAHPNRSPEVIFIKAIESAPFAPPPELEVEGREELFEAGLKALADLAPVHLIFREGSSSAAFTDAKAELHAASGPHPVGNPSVHIAAIHPIRSSDQVVWTLRVVDVIAVGKWILEGTYYTERVISIAGSGVEKERRGYYRVHSGFPIRDLVEKTDGLRLISGDPLMGEKVEKEGFLGFYHHVFCALPEDVSKREFLHFLKLSRKGYTASKAYFFRKKMGELTTLLHGEERAFVDGVIYDRVMPLPIETMPLIKMLLTEEYEKGEALGILEVVPEDFALPAFVCPSKIEMTDIVKEGLKAYAIQYLED